jgi:hypothetical protein
MDAPTRMIGRNSPQPEDILVYVARAIEGSLIGYLVCGVFISIFWYPSFLAMMAFAVALRNLFEGKKMQQEIPPLSPALSGFLKGAPIEGPTSSWMALSG